MADRTGVRGKRLGTLFSVLAIALLLVSCGGSDSGNNTGNGGGGDTADEAPVNEAQAIFIEVGCAECHGDNGERAEGSMRALTSTMMISDQFTTRVRNGRGQAKPGFSADQISDEEILMIYEWITNR